MQHTPILQPRACLHRVICTHCGVCATPMQFCFGFCFFFVLYFSNLLIEFGCLFNCFPHAHTFTFTSTHFPTHHALVRRGCFWDRNLEPSEDAGPASRSPPWVAESENETDDTARFTFQSNRHKTHSCPPGGVGWGTPTLNRCDGVREWC